MLENERGPIGLYCTYVWHATCRTLESERGPICLCLRKAGYCPHARIECGPICLCLRPAGYLPHARNKRGPIPFAHFLAHWETFPNTVCDLALNPFKIILINAQTFLQLDFCV